MQQNRLILRSLHIGESSSKSDLPFAHPRKNSPDLHQSQEKPLACPLSPIRGDATGACNIKTTLNREYSQLVSRSAGHRQIAEK